MSTQPKLHLRLADRDELVPEFAPALLSQFIEPQTVKCLGVGVEVGIE